MIYNYSNIKKTLSAKITPIIKAALISSLLLSLFSCNNFFEDTNLERTQETKTTSSKTYLIIQPDSVKMGDRSVRPDIDAALSKLKSITLKGQKSGGSNKTIATTSDGQTIKDLYNKQLILEDGAGTYTFELQGNIDSVYFYQKITGVVIEESKTNVIAFDNLTPVKSSSDYTAFDNYGGFDIKLNLVYQNSSTIINKTVKTLTQLRRADGEALETYEPIETTVYSNPTSIEYKRWASYSATNSEGCLPVGTYRVTFDFYWKEKTDPVEYQLLNTLSYIVNVSHGLNSIFEDTIDINEVYSISYNDCHDITGHGLSCGMSEGQIKVNNYSRKSQNIVLPRYYRAHALFLGWFTEMYGGERITNIPTGSSQNYQLYAHWQAIEETTGAPLTMYVTPTSLYSYGCSEELGLKNLTEANKTIKEAMSYYDPNTTIKLKGVIEESGQSLNGPSYLNACATSIILEGSTPTAAGYDPADGINAGLTTATENGVALSINTTVPVTLSNLKITGGNNSNTADETVRGGGLYISSTSNVILEDVLILSNDAATAGKGIYNEGSLKIKGSTKVDGDIYLAAGKTLTIAGELTSTADTIASITPATYSNTTVVLSVESGSGVTLDETLCSKFAVTPQVVNGVTTNWTIDAEGKLVSQSGGNASIIAPSDTDFVTITDAAYYDISGMENNPVGPNGEYVFPKMKVLKREITQAEYESFMTYETGFAPSEDEDAKATTSAYYVSWAEALIYCNLLSIHQGLEPVYQMRLNLDGTNKLYTDPADWVQDENTGIRTSNGKYYLDPSGVDANEYGEQTYWQQDFNDGAHIVYNNAANGYRLPLVNEWAYITNLAQAGTISDMTDNTKNVYEWCSGCNYNYDLSQSYVTQNMGSSWDDYNSFTSNDTKPYVHEGMSNLGFRIIRYTLQDDFVNVEGQTNHEVYDGDYDTLQLNSINNGDTFNIKNLLVQKQEVSQSDYELFMKYTSGYEPAESGAAKKTTPAYYVSWAEAVIYCNMLSLAHDLTPVYGIKWNDGGTLTNHTDPKDWATKTDTGVTISDSKYSVTDNNSDAQKAYWIPDYKGNSYYFHIDNTANGYRLPTKTEWAYISGKVKNASSGSQLTNIGDNNSKNVNEWCLAFDNDGSAENYCYSTSEMGVAEFTTNNIFSTANDSYDQNPDSGTYVRITSHIGTSNIGFRVVRNAE